jgi:hypothetical protein
MVPVASLWLFRVTFRRRGRPKPPRSLAHLPIARRHAEYVRRDGQRLSADADVRRVSELHTLETQRQVNVTVARIALRLPIMRRPYGVWRSAIPPCAPEIDR